MNQETKMHEEVQAQKQILDSGNRRQFYDKDGKPLGVRDIDDNKGYEHLLPMDIISKMLTYRDGHPDILNPLSESYMFEAISDFMNTGSEEILYNLLHSFICREYANKDYKPDYEKAIMLLALHYREGSSKYGARSWEAGLPCHCFIDSALRHGMKYFRGDQDEPHDRAFIWNIVGLLWMMKHKPELNDLPFANQEAAQ